MITKYALIAAFSAPTVTLASGRHIRGSMHNGKGMEHKHEDENSSEWDTVGDKWIEHSDSMEVEGVRKLQSADPLLHDLKAELAEHDSLDIDSIAHVEDSSWLEEHKEVHLAEQNHRNLKETGIKIRNECREAIDAVVIFSEGGAWKIKWQTINPNTETSADVASTNQKIIYMYAESESYEWAGDSTWCFSGGSPCLEEIDMGGNSDRFTYTYSCSNGMPSEVGSSETATGGNGGNGGGSSATGRDRDWLNAHNERRQMEHGTIYVPLNWSTDLATSAKRYAAKLIKRSGCTVLHNYQGDKYGGENLAVNWGSSGRRTPNNVLTRWVENERNKPYRQNLHMMQVLWRATEYVGCGEASKSYQGGQCHIQVCRYLRPGNCNTNAGNWRKKMFEDSSSCTPYKPKDA